jgi:hypothetical protein
VTRYGPLFELPTGAEGVSYAPCLEGEAVSGGGFAFIGNPPESSNYRVFADRPSVKVPPPDPFPEPENGGTATGWAVDIDNDTGLTVKFRAYVQCASP